MIATRCTRSLLGENLAPIECSLSVRRKSGRSAPEGAVVAIRHGWTRARWSGLGNSLANLSGLKAFRPNIFPCGRVHGRKYSPTRLSGGDRHDCGSEVGDPAHGIFPVRASL